MRTKHELQEEWQKRIKHYAPRNDKEIKMHEYIRTVILDTGELLMKHLPEQVITSREFAQVMTDLENAMMHCNAAYARHKGEN